MASWLVEHVERRPLVPAELLRANKCLRGQQRAWLGEGSISDKDLIAAKRDLQLPIAHRADRLDVLAWLRPLVRQA